jgi:NAD(P)-dependent dehydrogenase (short-subunit alcohol dehydrogenase family)
MSTGFTIDWRRYAGWLAGRRVLVTGASRGIGRALAEASARAGADVALFATSLSKLEDSAAALRANGGMVACFAADLGDAAALKRAVAEAEQALGGIDILLNNAGSAVRGTLLDLDLAAFARLMEVNVVGCAAAAQIVVPGMIARGWGRVINVSSIYARHPVRNLAAYAISKAAVEMLTRQMALEWAGTGVTANAIGPAQVLTDLSRPSWDDPQRRAQVTSQIPAGRWLTTDDLVGTYLHLASDASAMTTGQTLFVDGGRSLL